MINLTFPLVVTLKMMINQVCNNQGISFRHNLYEVPVDSEFNEFMKL